MPTDNRPGLSTLRYRVGTHATFFETMQARLSSGDYPELADLRTREKSDPSIALLDAWSIVGDVLSFYQERIANEGYLRTATERRSVLELARLIGYALRPGVSASVYLAYSLDKNAEPVTIPQGARANSIPGPGEQMQAFETSEPLEARVEWNAINPRITQPQTAASIAQNGLYLNGTATRLKANDPLLIDYADGNGLQLVHIASVAEDSESQRTCVLLRTEATEATMAALIQRYRDVQNFGVSPDSATAGRVLTLIEEIGHAGAEGDAALATHLDAAALPKLKAELSKAQSGHFTKLTPWLSGLINDLQTQRARIGPTPTPAMGLIRAPGKRNLLGGLIDRLVLPPSVPPASARQLPRSVGTAFGGQSDMVPRLLTLMQPLLKGVFYRSWKSLPPPQPQPIRVYALRVAAAPFGHNAPLRQIEFNKDKNQATFGEWNIDDPWNTGNGGGPILMLKKAKETAAPDHHEPRTLYLDNDYDIAPDSYVAIEKVDGETIVTPPVLLTHRSLAAYGLSGKTVQVDLPDTATGWVDSGSSDFTPVRTTRVYAGSEQLDLAEEPITDMVAGDEIELGDVYDDLQPGRWLIVAGERADVVVGGVAASGVKAAELVMLAAVTQKVREVNNEPVAGDTLHTHLTLAKPLAYAYKRDTVTIYGNVVKATNGETRQETLGGGDATQALQQFTLKQPPLTYVSAPTVSGVASTLEVRVNDVAWHEVDSLAGLAANARTFITSTDDAAKTTVVFGNGEHGARLPTGPENVKATYRNGIGKPGNVRAGQISLLNTRPLGVKEVINPIRASGGADKEARDQARRNAPLAVMALDRLVSTPDYADFSRTFGGIGKAAAARLGNGRQQLVHVTIAGVDDIPIDATSDLYRNLYDALHRYGDPYLPIRLAVRERLALVVSANIRVDQDYQWETLEPRVRSAVLDAFGFDNVDLAQDLLLADAIRVIQAVPGVVYVDVDVFDTISGDDLLAGFTASAASALGLRDRILIEPARFEQGLLQPAQLSYLSSEVPDTLILQEIKP
ncbi:MAG: putative baseplate assembly protein [Hydrogenophilales bacterium]|nr:putative baseplate assembly protein [Hydrogenophilales bacterium]